MPNFQSPYSKAVLPISELVSHLIDRGLSVPDVEFAKRYLARVGYYRFRGYALAFRDCNDIEKPFIVGTNFDNVVNLIEFDSELRVLMSRGVAPIEIMFRTSVNEYMSHQHCTPFWYQEEGLFMREYKHAAFLSRAKQQFEKSKELFAKHYRDTYDYPYMPPSWMLSELTSFGAWSCLFKNIKDSVDKTAICERMGNIPHAVLSNWIHVASSVRNICAHHGRLWNRVFGVRPMFRRRYPQPDFLRSNNRLGAIVVSMVNLHNAMGLCPNWRLEFITLLRAHQEIAIAKLGFNPAWDQDQFWE